MVDMKRCRTIDFLGTAALSCLILWLLLNACVSCYAIDVATKDSSRSRTLAKDSGHIPNHVHFVRLLELPGDELTFEFSDFLSICAAEHYWQPRTTYIHTNAVAETIQHARDGKAGRWTQLILQMPNVKVLRVSPPSSQTSHVAQVDSLAHQTELVAVRAVRDLGGVYLDSSIHALNDVREYREGKAPGFVLAKTTDGSITTAMFMSAKGGDVVRHWADELQRSYSQSIVPAANDTLASVIGSMQADYYEMRILDAAALPGMQSDAGAGRKLAAASRQLTVQDGKHGGFSRWASNHVTEQDDDGETESSENRPFLKVAALRAGTALDGLRPEDALTSNSPLAELVRPMVKLIQDAGLIRTKKL